MNLKEKIFPEIEALPAEKLAEAMTLIQSLQKQPSPTTAASFLAHLKSIGTWTGDDLLECLEAVQESGGAAEFNYTSNSFD